MLSNSNTRYACKNPVRVSVSIIGLLFAVIASLGACAPEETPGSKLGNDAIRVSQVLQIPVHALEGSRTPSRPYPATLVLPAGRGTFPVVILLHGCGGIRASLSRWATRLWGWGYATLVLDSFSPRGVSSVCVDQTKVTVTDRAADVLSAALFLRTNPAIDASRIAVLGLSHGGTTAAMVATHPQRDVFAGLIGAAIAYYGSCGWRTDYFGKVPLLALAGEADSYGPAASCGLFAAKLDLDQPFVLKTYPGVVHGFDTPQNPGVNEAGHMVAFAPLAAADSYEQVHSFLQKYLGK